MLAWIPVAALMLAGLGGIAAGLGRARFQPAPVIANVIIVATYAAAVAAVAAWASQCWNCNLSGSYEDDRSFLYYVTVVFLGLFAIVGVALTWIAALVSTWIWRGQSPLNVRGVVLSWAVLIFAVAVLVNFPPS